jgi:hypothetical protein
MPWASTEAYLSSSGKEKTGKKKGKVIFFLFFKASGEEKGIKTEDITKLRT